MYFADLTPYTYGLEEGDPPALNIGWLDAAEPFSRGTTPDGFVERLRNLLKERYVQTRGLHVCQFCFLADAPWIRGMDTDRDVYFSCLQDGRLSSAEIRVQGQDGKWYAAPLMIAHYVEEHGYRPPIEFIDAVMRPTKAEQVVPPNGP